MFVVLYSEGCGKLRIKINRMKTDITERTDITEAETENIRPAPNRRLTS